MSGLLISKDYSYTLLDPRDLRDFAGLTTSTVTQKQNIRVEVSWELIKWSLDGMFGNVVEGKDLNETPTLRVSIASIQTSYWHLFG